MAVRPLSKNEKILIFESGEWLEKMSVAGNPVK